MFNTVFSVALAIPKAKTIEFKSIKKLREWADDLWEFWGRFEGFPEYHNSVRSELTAVRDLRYALNNYKEGDAGSLSQIQRAAERVRFDALGSEARMVKMLADRNPGGAVMCLARIIHTVDADTVRTWAHHNPVEFFYSQLYLSYLKEGLPPVATAASKESLSKLVAEFESNLSESNDHVHQLAMELEDIKSRKAQLLTQWTAEFESQKNEQSAIFSDSCANAKGHFDSTASELANDVAALKEKYEQLMQLQAPVKYWETRGGYHKELATTLAKVLAGAMTGFGVGAFYFAKYLFEAVDLAKSGEHWPMLSRSAFFLLAVSLGIWLLRILARLFMSNVHLMNESRERVTMIQTYLALSQNDGIRPDERLLALGSIFRHSTSGIVTDDAAPPFPTDVLKKFKD